MPSQLKRRTRRGRRTRVARQQEVALTRLLLELIDELGKSEAMNVDLYNEVKSMAEPLVRAEEENDGEISA